MKFQKNIGAVFGYFQQTRSAPCILGVGFRNHFYRVRLAEYIRYSGFVLQLFSGFPQPDYCDCCGKYVCQSEEPQEWTVEWVPASPTQE